MDIHIAGEKRKLPWKKLIILAGSVLSTTFLLTHLFPVEKALIWFGFISIPTQMLISPAPHEPFLLETSKYFAPLPISIAGTIGCCIAGIFDYLLLIPLLNHDNVRPRFEKSRLFNRAMVFFQKSPFWLLVFAALTPIPFYPFKFLSIAGNYPMWRYLAALAVGRTPRYYILAVLGFMLQPPTWMLVALFFVLVLPPLCQKLYKRYFQKDGSGAKSAATADAVGTSFDSSFEEVTDKAT